MLGEVLLIEDKHRRLGQAIAEALLSDFKPKMVIGIAGDSGTGKSELGHVVAKGLFAASRSCKVISTDNFYRIAPKKRAEWRQREGIEKVVGYDEYDWPAIAKLLRDFRHNRSSTMPSVDLLTQEIDQLIVDFALVDCLILEGLYSIKANDLDLRVFIELSHYENKKAQLLRNKETMNAHRMEVLAQEHKMVQALRGQAHLLVTKDYQLTTGPAAQDGLERDAPLTVAANEA